MLNVPKTFAAGDSVVWTDAEIYGADGLLFTSDVYSLSFAFRGTQALNAVAVADGAGFKTTLTATANIAPGDYFWQAYITKISTGERLTIAEGRTRVAPNLAALTTAFDGRSETEKQLDQVNAAISARLAGKAVAEYQILGRNLKYVPLTELQEMRRQLHRELNQSAQAKNGRNRRLARFTR
ncbi:MAG: hypothetical protein MH252_08455 [Thermosynechococcaceae cyanobacterium MS004]|nr:hypothetical protein [Thermosynechococcaceae cyanobacterium MS004]